MRRWTLAAGLAGWGVLFLGIDALATVFFALRPCDPGPSPETCASALFEPGLALLPLVLLAPILLAPPNARARASAAAISCLTLVVAPLLLALVVVVTRI